MLWGIHVYRTRNIVGAGEQVAGGWRRKGGKGREAGVSKKAEVIYFALKYFQKHEVKIFLIYIYLILRVKTCKALFHDLYGSC